MLPRRDITAGRDKMRALLVTAALLLGATGVANAENFTVTGKNTSVARVGGPGPMGKPVGAGHGTSEAEVIWASGAKSTWKGDCMGWTAPPTSGFSSQGVCSWTDSDGSKIFMLSSCISLNEKNTSTDCWGRLTGLSGKWEGKVGTASWRGTQNPDGNGGTVAGAGTRN
jgi:hypothetical protein